MPAAREAEFAPAKLNLCLHVLGRRDDGFHELDTLAVFVDLGDEVAIDPDGAPGSLIIAGPFAEHLALETSGSNLIDKAAAAIERLSGQPPPPLRLTKALPVASGLGGGSADAAATLRLLDRVNSLGLADERLAEIGASIGADVPMCVHSRPLRARGRGEAIEPIASFPALPLVLVNPGVAVETRAVFAGIAAPYDDPLPDFPPAFESIDAVVDWLKRTRNALQPAAINLAPAIEEVLASLDAQPGALLTRMSGSGATCFATFEDADRAAAAAAEIAENRPNWWTRATVAAAAG